ncbi:MAG: hypothetical protein IJ446_01215 [Oscillospiraceae bacterium]|nr:hypothetical protein [Oscillospiraceae bacterium]
MSGKRNPIPVMAAGIIVGLALRKAAKKRYADIQKEYVEDYIRETGNYLEGKTVESRKIAANSYYWHMQFPISANKNNMAALRKVLSSMRHDYYDYLIVDVNNGAYKKEYGHVTYVQATRREKAYQLELHFEAADGTQKQFVRFIPDFIYAEKLLETLLVKRRVPDMTKWFDCTKYVIKEL